MCRLNLSLSSIWIPRSSTGETEFITRLSVWKFVFVTLERFLFNTIAWNLSWFTIILFILNHSIAILLSDSNSFIRSEIVFAQAESVLSSVKLWTEEDLIKKKGCWLRSQIEVDQLLSLVVRLKWYFWSCYIFKYCGIVYTDTLFPII